MTILTTRSWGWFFISQIIHHKKSRPGTRTVLWRCPDETQLLLARAGWFWVIYSFLSVFIRVKRTIAFWKLAGQSYQIYYKLLLGLRILVPAHCSFTTAVFILCDFKWSTAHRQSPCVTEMCRFCNKSAAKENSIHEVFFSLAYVASIDRASLCIQSVLGSSKLLFRHC